MLAVDDDPRALKFVRYSLSSASFQQIVTGDPDHVVFLMEANEPRVVLLDLMPPRIDGIEMTMDMLAVGDVPVIFLSAYHQDDAFARAFAVKAVDYMAKPLSPTELVARVKVSSSSSESPLDHSE